MSGEASAAHGEGGAAGAGLTREQELERLSTQELHDRAIRRAERHLDVKFLWSLLKAIPAAETVSGDPGEGEYDSQFLKGLIFDAVRSGDGRLGEALRPLFIDYLRRHPDA